MTEELKALIPCPLCKSNKYVYYRPFSDWIMCRKCVCGAPKKAWNTRVESRPIVRELVEALENIAEYWNRNENERAMSDALNYIINKAEHVLSKHKLQQ